MYKFYEYYYFFSVEDVSSLAEAVSLIDISLDGNPVALGGDCTPFLVSYLPNLQTLTNMNVTQQVKNCNKNISLRRYFLAALINFHYNLKVRHAAMAWRNNKEAAHAAYCALGGIAQQEARRDQIINNARTNWELLRSENKCFVSTPIPTKNEEIDKEFALEVSSTATTLSGSTQTIELAAMPDVVMTLQQHETEDSDCRTNNSDNIKILSENVPKPSPIKKLQRSATTRKAPERRVNFSDRSVSQDTDASHSTSTSSEIRLPPILLPIISSLENVKLADSNEPILKRWESISSVEPFVDSSFSSLPSSSESEDERSKKPVRRMHTAFRRRENFGSMRSKSVCDPESRRVKAKNSDNIESMSNISTNTNVGSVSSTSGSEQNNKVLRREGSLNSRLSNRNIRSATTTRRTERASSANRASTARVKSGKSLSSFKTSEPVPKPMPISKDREQGNFITNSISSHFPGILTYLKLFLQVLTI